MSCYIIAEAGSNHDGSLDIAKQLVDTAKYAGCDAVKFQIFSAETLYSKNSQNFDKYQNVWELIKSLEVSFDFFKEIKKYCDIQQIEFLATPFSVDAVNLLVEMNVPAIKIASFEFTDIFLVSYIASTRKSIIASTGLCNEHDIKQFLSWTKESDVTLLHCNSAYPTPSSDANLLAINKLKSICEGHNVKYGLSDHTMGILSPALAVSLGASVIEKHFTLSRKRNGPDHPFALEPDELKNMVFLIREAELLLGYGSLCRTKSEQSMFYARRSLVASKDIKQGEVICENNLTTKRPGSGVPASLYFETIGKVSTRNIKEDDIIQYEDFV